MHVVDLRELANLNQCCLIWWIVEDKSATQVSRIQLGAIVGRNNGHDNAPSARGSRWALGRWRIFLKKSNPGLRIICVRVGARGVQHALDRVRGAGDVGPAFEVCE